MSKAQPTLREAFAEQERGIKILEECEVRLNWGQRGFSYRPRGLGKQHGFAIYEWPMSDISKKCNGCGRCIVERRDGNPHQRIVLDREMLNPWHRCNNLERWEYGYFCLSCQNRRRPLQAANQEWWETTKVINKAKREIRNAKGCN